MEGFTAEANKFNMVGNFTNFTNQMVSGSGMFWNRNIIPLHLLIKLTCGIINIVYVVL